MEPKNIINKKFNGTKMNNGSEKIAFKLSRHKTMRIVKGKEKKRNEFLYQRGTKLIIKTKNVN